MNCSDFCAFINVVSNWNDYVNNVYDASDGAVDIGMTESATLADNYIALIAKNLCDEDKHYEDILEILFWFVFVNGCGTENHYITDVKPNVPAVRISSCIQMYNWLVNNYNL